MWFSGAVHGTDVTETGLVQTVMTVELTCHSSVVLDSEFIIPCQTQGLCVEKLYNTNML